MKAKLITSIDSVNVLQADVGLFLKEVVGNADEVNINYSTCPLGVNGVIHYSVLITWRNKP
jgi:hypothetical protein